MMDWDSRGRVTPAEAQLVMAVLVCACVQTLT